MQRELDRCASSDMKHFLILQAPVAPLVGEATVCLLVGAACSEGNSTKTWLVACLVWLSGCDLQCGVVACVW